MPLTSRIKIPYPSENKPNWYPDFESMVEKMDSVLFGSRENQNLILMGGGTVSFNVSGTTGTLTWTSILKLFVPSTGFSYQLSPTSVLLNDKEFFYVTLTRSPTQDTNVSIIKATTLEQVVLPDDVYVIGYRTGNFVYFHGSYIIQHGESGLLFETTTLGAAALSGATPTQIDAGDTGFAGASGLASRSDHEHILNTGLVGDLVSVDASAAGAGTSLKIPRADHKHTVLTGTPGSVTFTSAGAGSASTLAKSDHIHGMVSGTPVATGTANAEGSSANPARLDHVHKTNYTAKSAGTTVGTRGSFNYGTNFSVVDNSGADRVDINVGTTPFTFADNITINGTKTVTVGGNLLIGSFGGVDDRLSAEKLAISGQTEGDFLVSDGSDFVRFPSGETNQVIVGSGGGNIPSYSSTIKPVTWGSTVSDGGSSVAHIIDNENTFSTSGAKLLSIRNNTTEKLNIDKDGTLNNNTDVNTGVQVIKNTSRLGIQGSTEIRLTTPTLTFNTTTMVDMSSAASTISSGAQTLTVTNNFTSIKLDQGHSSSNPTILATTGSSGSSTTDRYGFKYTHTAGSTVNNVQENGLRIDVTDSRSALTGDVIGIHVDSSLGTNTSSTRLAARLRGGPTEIQQGLSTSNAKASGVVNINTTEVGNVGTGEDNLITHSLVASSLGVNGDSIEIESWGTFAANGNNKTVKLYFGSTVLFNTTAVALNGGSWNIKCTLVRTGATTQIATAVFSGDTVLVTNTSSYSTPGETLSNAITIKCTGEATSNDDIIQKGLLIKWNPSKS